MFAKLQQLYDYLAKNLGSQEGYLITASSGNTGPSGGIITISTKIADSGLFLKIAEVNVTSFTPDFVFQFYPGHTELEYDFILCALSNFKFS